MQLKLLDFLQRYVKKQLQPTDTTVVNYPPPIAKTLGFDIVEVGEAMSIMEMTTDPARHANPMGTVHGGILGDLADAAIGTAHATTLGEGESFTSIDLHINFFRPVWKEKIRAHAKVIHRGRNVSYYGCDVTRSEDGKLIASVTSTVMTLRGEAAKGR